MLEGLRARYHALHRRIQRIERRELAEFRGWIEHTGNLTRLSVVLFVPLLIAIVTLLSSNFNLLPFLLFPPLAASTYTLFSDPGGRYSSPGQFVAGLTTGALSGWAALEIAARFLYRVPVQDLQVGAGSAALAIFLTAIVTWVLKIDLPTAYSTALLTLVTGASHLAYVISVVLSSTLVAVVFIIWRDQFYNRRAQYLYRSLSGDDQVLIPMRGEHSDTVAMFGAQLAAAHEAGKAVLVDVVPDTATANAEKDVLTERNTQVALFDDEGPKGVVQSDGSNDTAVETPVEQAAAELEKQADRIRTELDIPCEVIVAVDGTTPTSTTILETAREANCDLIVTPYEQEEGEYSSFIRELFRGRYIDVIALRTNGAHTQWTDVLVPIRVAGNLAHSMIDFAYRLAGQPGGVSVCTCIPGAPQRRQAELMLANLVDAFPGEFEIRVSRASIEDFLSANASHHDLIIIGASTDRSTVSRFFSRPTFERINNLDCDVAIVDSS